MFINIAHAYIRNFMIVKRDEYGFISLKDFERQHRILKTASRIDTSIRRFFKPVYALLGLEF